MFTLVLDGKNKTLSCSGFPGCWVVNTCWEFFMSFPAREEWFFLQFQSISFSLLLFLLGISLSYLQIAHSKALVISKTFFFFF